MNPRRIIILAIAAVVAVTIGVLLANRSTHTSLDGEHLYPDLQAQADSVSAIRIYKAGDERAIEILRDGAAWTLTERHAHPIAAVKARNLVRALANAKLLEEKTSDPAKYSALSVEDVNTEGAEGVRIELEGPASAVNLIVGKDGPGGKSSYVRRVGDSTSWLVSEQLSASPEPRDWLQKELVNISADRIQAATISIAGQKPYTAAKSSRADADFAVEPLPKGKELTSSSAANPLATALLNLSLDDVRLKSELADDKPSAQATYKTFDGLVLELAGFEKDEKHYLTLTASFDAALAERFKVKTADDEKSQSASEATAEAGTTTESAADASASVAKEASELTAKAANWAYEIPGYKYDAIFRPLDQMLK